MSDRHDDGDTLTMPFGIAHPRRGMKYHDLAVEFAKAFPIGSTLRWDQFSEWQETVAKSMKPDEAHALGLYAIPSTTDTATAEWRQHLDQRHALRYDLNKAAAHPRMINAVGYAFHIDIHVHKHMLIVNTVQSSVIIHNNIPKAIESVFRTKRRALRHLQQAINFPLLAPHERMAILEHGHDLDGFQRILAVQVELMMARHERLRIMIARKVEAGDLSNSNGVQRFLTENIEDDSEDDSGA